MKVSRNIALRVFVGVCLVPIIIILVCQLLMLGDATVTPPIMSETNDPMRQVLTPQSRSMPFVKRIVPSGDAEIPPPGESITLTTNSVSDPEILARQRSNAIAVFLQSPARNTPECRKILDILLSHGYSIEQLRPVYDLAYHIGTFDPEYVAPSVRINGASFDANNLNHLAASQMFKENAIRSSRSSLERFGFASDVVNDILAVQPRVFYGNVGVEIDLGSPESFTDDDLMRYLSNNTASP